MSRVAVTGGCGFVGSHLAEALVRRGDEVVIVDGAPPAAVPAAIRGHAAYVQADVRDPEAVAEAINPGIDTVFHLASVVGVDRYLSRPLDVIDVNFGGTRNVLEAAVKAGARVLMASTSEVFGKNPAVPWPEDGDRVVGATSADRWTYSTSKSLAEHLTYAFIRQHGLDATIVRYFNVYGPRQRPAYVISRSVHRALNGTPPALYDGGGQTRCFTYVDDAVEGTLRAAAQPGGGSFNLGGTEETTVAEAVALVARMTGFGGGSTAVDTGERLGAAYEDLPRRVPDTTRARELLGWECSTSLPEGVAKTIEWARDHPEWLAMRDSGAT
ncbi:NAD-dependent epimerase/dehydratase family protein [Actinomadura sediminis]|uniref:NAD-dependent epimerase/dehydratase family protein n=1 Tax=Actinomadura sediminis TaxID=1038904 RepID=A0ABW3EJY5_9ACTN